MIDIQNEMFNSYSESPQFSNLWDFYLLDWYNSSFNISKLKVISSSLPMIKFNYESYDPTGQKYYTGFALPESFSIVFREDSSFSVFNYFKEWESQIFDEETGCFISDENEKTRDGVLQYTKFVLNASYRDLFERFTLQKIENLAKQAQATAFNTIPNLGNKIPGGASMPYAKQILQSSMSKLAKDTDFSLISPIGELFTEEITKSFDFLGVRYLGMGEIQNNYEQSNELSITVNFAVDRITDRLAIKFPKARGFRNIELFN